MIDFACKRFVIDDIVKCAFGLSKSEFLVFKHLVDNPDVAYTSSELAKLLTLDMSTAQRGLKKLHEQDVLFRSQLNLSQGGYVFTYQLKNPDYIRKQIHLILKNWLKRVDEELGSWL